MKKILATIAAIAAGALLFAACDPEELTPEELVREMTNKYALASEAGTIEEEIEIVSGVVLQYESKTTYAKNDDGYAYTKSTKKLNDLSAESAYAEKTESGTTAGGRGNATVDLTKLKLESVTVSETTLTATIADEDVAGVFGLTEALPAPTTGTKLTLTADETHVLSVVVAYASGTSSVSVSVSFKYA